MEGGVTIIQINVSSLNNMFVKRNGQHVFGCLSSTKCKQAGSSSLNLRHIIQRLQDGVYDVTLSISDTTRAILEGDWTIEIDDLNIFKKTNCTLVGK